MKVFFMIVFAPLFVVGVVVAVAGFVLMAPFIGVAGLNAVLNIKGEK